LSLTGEQTLSKHCP